MLAAPLAFAMVFYSTIPSKAGAVIDILLGNEQEELLFVGDVLLARDVEARMDRYGSEYPYKGLTDLFRGRLVVANFEAAVPQVHQPTPNLVTRFSVNDKYLPDLSKAGIDIVSLANNHSWDYGEEGFHNTVAELNKVGIDNFGDQRSLAEDRILYRTEGNQTLAFIGINLVARNWSQESIEDLLRTASKNSDIQIVSVHWGEEYELVHNESQEQYALWFIDAGADLVVGQHPHVVQDIAVYDGVPVFYSLGNFIFDQYFSQDVLEGLTIAVTFTGSKLDVELYPVSSEDTYAQPQVLWGQGRDDFLEKIAKSSDRSLRRMILKGQLNF